MTLGYPVDSKGYEVTSKGYHVGALTTTEEIDNFENSWENSGSWSGDVAEFTSSTAHVVDGSESLRTTDNQDSSNIVSYSGLPSYPRYGVESRFYHYVDSGNGDGDVNMVYRIAEDSVDSGWVDLFIVNSITTPETRLRRETTAGSSKTVVTGAVPPFDSVIEFRWFWDDGTLGKGGDNTHTVEYYDLGADGTATPSLVDSLSLTFNDLQTRESMRLWISSNLSTVSRVFYDHLHVRP